MRAFMFGLYLYERKKTSETIELELANTESQVNVNCRLGN